MSQDHRHPQRNADHAEQRPAPVGDQRGNVNPPERQPAHRSRPPLHGRSTSKSPSSSPTWSVRWKAGRLGFGVGCTGVLVETLLGRGTAADLAEAQTAIGRLANLQADEGLTIREITLLRLRALLARARGDDVAYRDLVDRYRTMAESLGYEGHIGWVKAM